MGGFPRRAVRTHAGGTVVFNSTGSVTHTFGGAVFNTATVGTASGLVGYWKLDETSGTNLADSSTYGNDGTLSGTLTTATPATGFGFTNTSAITLNGTNVTASMGTIGMPNPNAAQSISLWVKLVNLTGQQNFIVMTDKVSGAIELGIKDGVVRYGGGARSTW